VADQPWTNLLPCGSGADRTGTRDTHCSNSCGAYNERMRKRLFMLSALLLLVGLVLGTRYRDVGRARIRNHPHVRLQELDWAASARPVADAPASGLKMTRATRMLTA
jgi:predicted nucleic acid-binding Zn ribbon protein